MPRGAVRQGRRGALPELRARAHRRLLLRGRLDPALGRRAVHPHRRDHPAPARQHRPAGRRHHGAARPRLDPGLDRHPDALQPPPRLPADAARRGTTTNFADYLRDNGSQRGWWSEFPKYIVSLLKAWYGEAATAGQRLVLRPPAPPLRRPLAHDDGGGDGRRRGQGLLPDGREPDRRLDARRPPSQGACASSTGWWCATSRRPRRAEFWRDAPEIERGEVRPEDIATEVFFFPCAAHTEKDGAFTNTQRLLQWHHKAIEPPGDCRSELHFIYHLGRILKRLYAGSQEPRDRPLQDVTWDYPTQAPAARTTPSRPPRRCSPRSTATRSADGKPVAGFAELRDDGSTACGCWIYSGSYKDGVNQPARRKPGREQSWVAPEWGWAWPANRRILYNRASADPEGRPWSERKRYVWWDAEAKRWTGEDVPDFIVDRPPSYRPPADAQGIATIGGDRSVHHAGRRPGLDLRPQRPPRRTAPHPLRAAGVDPREPALRPAVQPRPHGVEAARQPLPPRLGRPALPLRPDHLPADRAPHRRRHVALALLALRAAAGDVLRGLARSWRGRSGSTTAAGRR